MAKMWAGRFTKETDQGVNDFNSSIAFDARMYRHDIAGSIAHATMLAHQGIISQADADAIIEGLGSIRADIDSGALQFDPQAEDIHMFIEAELTSRIGDAGKRLHTARSRNDQVALDIRLILRDEVDEIKALTVTLIKTLCDMALENTETIMPGYTHLQRAQPITFAQHLMAYASMFIRDLGRLGDLKKRMNFCPLGSGALAGTTYPIDREMTASLLGFTAPVMNTLDGVSDRDFCIELASAISLIMMHLSRFSEEIIIWSSDDYKYIELSDSYSTGSSIMPQKKNPDMNELIRGKTGRVYGDLMALLTVMKGIPLAYDKDMQEDKESVFDAYDTLRASLVVFDGLLGEATFNTRRMRECTDGGFTSATECADYLVGKGVPFRDAHAIVGRLVVYCIENGKTLQSLTLDEYRKFGDFDEGIYNAIGAETAISRRKAPGSPSPDRMSEELAALKDKLAKG